jgi:hypothetical protein
MKKRKPENKIYTIKVYCAKCKTLLYRYQKEGLGLLVKCYKDRIIEDCTKRDLRCPNCQQIFARHAFYRNRPANKIIQGKVFVRK